MVCRSLGVQQMPCAPVPGSQQLMLSQGSARTASSLGLDDNDSVWDPGAGGDRDGGLASLTYPADPEQRSTTGTTTGTCVFGTAAQAESKCKG